jgi:hypothetical protein
MTVLPWTPGAEKSGACAPTDRAAKAGAAKTSDNRAVVTVATDFMAILRNRQPGLMRHSILTRTAIATLLAKALFPAEYKAYLVSSRLTANRRGDITCRRIERYSLTVNRKP